MSGEKKAADTETILMALDQISQTIEVMTSVVGRLRNFVQAQPESRPNRRAADMTENLRADRILH